MFKKIFSEAAARRTASRISGATSVRAGEMVSRQCLWARRIHHTCPHPEHANTGSLPAGGTLNPERCENKAREAARLGIGGCNKAFFNIPSTDQASNNGSNDDFGLH